MHYLIVSHLIGFESYLKSKHSVSFGLVESGVFFQEVDITKLNLLSTPALVAGGLLQARSCQVMPSRQLFHLWSPINEYLLDTLLAHLLLPTPL